MITDIMSNNALSIYIGDRKLIPEKYRYLRDHQLSTMKKAVIHNAYTLDKVLTSFDTEHIEISTLTAGCRPGLLPRNTPLMFRPKRSAETHLWLPKGELHIINTRGHIRLGRDKDQIKGLGEIQNKEIKLEVRQYGGGKDAAAAQFRSFGFQRAQSVFEHLPLQRINKEGSLFVIFGRHASMKYDGVDMIYDSEENGNNQVLNEYLKVKVFGMNGRTVVHFDYAFGDQEDILMRKFYQQCADHLDPVDVHVFHYGSVASLSEKIGYNAVVTPEGAMEEKLVVKDDFTIMPLRNQLVTNSDVAHYFAQIIDEVIFRGNTLNSSSVLQQQKTVLEKAAKTHNDDCAQFIDMEMLALASNVAAAYPNVIPYYYLAGIVLDQPLEQEKSLGDLSYPYDQEQKIAYAFKEMIRAGKFTK